MTARMPRICDEIASVFNASSRCSSVPFLASSRRMCGGMIVQTACECVRQDVMASSHGAQLLKLNGASVFDLRAHPNSEQDCAPNDPAPYSVGTCRNPVEPSSAAANRSIR